MPSNLVVMERGAFKECPSMSSSFRTYFGVKTEGSKVRVSSRATMQDLQDMYGIFKACVGEHLVEFKKEDRVYDVVGYSENLYIFPESRGPDHNKSQSTTGAPTAP